MDFNLPTSAWMLLFFILFLIISLWKIWAFLPNKQLNDDDTTQEATQALENLMLQIILEQKGLLDEKELFIQMKKSEKFDEKLFWRFNLNRLKQLLNSYYIKHPKSSSIMSIYTKLS